jgi:DNA-binding response OmpR family regulator
MSPVPASSTAPPPVVSSCPAPDARRRVLAIDDDEGLLDMLVLLLSQANIELRTARGGRAGVELAASWDPDLILLDLTMPGLDGPAFLDSYRRTATSPAPVVLISGARDGSARAEELGAVTFLAKPFDLGVLVDLVDTHTQTGRRDVAPG